MDEVFDIQNNEQEFPFGSFTGADEADYDGFLREYMALVHEEDDGSKSALAKRERALKRMERFRIGHPWFELEKIQCLLRGGQTGEAAQNITALIEQNKEDEKAVYFLETAWSLSQMVKNYSERKGLLRNLMESCYWTGDFKKAKVYGEKYKKELEKKYEECKGLGLSVEEMLVRETTESRNTLYSMFCYAFYTEQYELARAYAEQMGGQSMCYWCFTDGCTEMWEVSGMLAMLDGRLEEAKEMQ